MAQTSRRTATTSRIALTLLLAALAPAAHAASNADPASPDTPYWRTNIFKRFAADQRFLVLQWYPQEFHRAWFTGPLVGAILFAAGSDRGPREGLDYRGQREFAQDRGGAQVGIGHALTTIGNAPFVAAGLAFTYLGARRHGDDHLAEAASLSGEALLDVGLWTIVVKSVAARLRPGAESHGQFFQYGSPRNGSFPSGHAAVAFSIATVFAEEYRRHRWVPWLAYGTASLIGAARIALGQHYPADVIFGATLGHSIADAVIARQGEHGGDWYDRITPLYDANHHGWGLGYQKRW